MGFSVALSGLNAAAKDLQVTGNNIANSNTTGFKESRAEFVDVYSASVFGTSKTQAGSGVRVANVAQQFNQGSSNFTNNNLDMAIAGEGFFSMSADPAATKPTTYTRSGEFKVNNEGFVVNNQDDYLMSFAPNGTTLAEGFTEGVFSPLQISSTQGAPAGTENITTEVNLNAQELKPAVFTSVDPTDATTYNHTSSITIYDSQGNAHIASMYYVTQTVGDIPETGATNQWDAYFFIDGEAFDSDGQHHSDDTATFPAALPMSSHAPTTLDFNTNGTLNTITTSAPVTVPPTIPTPAGVAIPSPQTFDIGPITSSDISDSLDVDPLQFSYGFGESTQFSSAFAVRDLAQDGLSVGTLTGIDIDDSGAVLARFSNGGIDVLGKVALTRFANSQGLAKVGDTSWEETVDSGEAIAGQAGTGNFGLIQSGALEGSTVDLSEQLVHLIIAQQAYQANAQTITTEKTIVQTILNA